MAKYRFTPLMTSHYDTPEAFDKTTRFVPVSQTMRLIRLSTVKAKSQGSATIAQHMPKQVQELYTSKAKHSN